MKEEGKRVESRYGLHGDHVAMGVSLRTNRLSKSEARKIRRTEEPELNLDRQHT
jgi:hypothetical protein